MVKFNTEFQLKIINFIIFSDLNRIHAHFVEVFESLFGEESLYETKDVEMSSRVAEAAFKQRFPELNQRLLKEQ